MSICDVVSLYVHNVDLIDYMKKVLLGMYVVDYTCHVDIGSR